MELFFRDVIKHVFLFLTYKFVLFWLLFTFSIEIFQFSVTNCHFIVCTFLKNLKIDQIFKVYFKCHTFVQLTDQKSCFLNKWILKNYFKWQSANIFTHLLLFYLWYLGTPRWRLLQTFTSSTWLWLTPWPPAHCLFKVPNTWWTPGPLENFCAKLLSASTTTICSPVSSPWPWWAWIATSPCATQSRRWDFEHLPRLRWSTFWSGSYLLQLVCLLWSWLWPKWQIPVRFAYVLRR